MKLEQEQKGASKETEWVVINGEGSTLKGLKEQV